MNRAAYREVSSQNSVPIVALQEHSAATHAARGAEAERQQVRAALHDGLGQLLTSISFLAGSLSARLAALQVPEAEQAEDIMALTRQAINETQTLVADLDARAKGA